MLLYNWRMNLSVFKNFLGSTKLWDILFTCWGALWNPWIPRKHACRPFVIILVGVPLSKGFILYDFNVSFRTKICPRCLFISAISGSTLKLEDSYVYLITHCHSEFCMDMNEAKLIICCSCGYISAVTLPRWTSTLLWLSIEIPMILFFAWEDLHVQQQTYSLENYSEILNKTNFVKQEYFDSGDNIWQYERYWEQFC